MAKKYCMACGKIFQTLPQVANQRYCSSAECQSERRRKWQKEKLKSDADYRDNQARAQSEWRRRNPDYWKSYRELNAEYVERNRDQQRNRNSQMKAITVAKMDASSIPPGIYRLIKVNSREIAKSNEWIVEIKVLSGPYSPFPKIVKR
ncbi:hypothetical protein [Herbaspirillum sp. RV1423]|uniref:hypothetical protein n=1 Tax=Herbaspirillum sp. RV1423 TaxID=1443993 RepID=UPI0009DCA60C|nr:hypothetical protein [Herbaspirillum sp. RV1423]